MKKRRLGDFDLIVSLIGEALRIPWWESISDLQSSALKILNTSHAVLDTLE